LESAKLELRGGGGGDVTSLPDPQGSNPLGPPGPELEALQNTIDEVFEFAGSRHGEVPLENDPVEAMKGADDETGELDQKARYCAYGILPRMVATTTNHSGR